MLDLTAQEKKVLIALGALAVLGLTVILYRTYIARPEIKVAAGKAAECPEMTGTGLVNINTADAAKIASLPDIGPKTAEKIVNYRETKGLYLLKEDIMKVEGIGPKTYGKIKGLIVLE
ncbi:MAG TPA: helix-hairpin-helix domain-containing protein [Candidatus Omnitrophota bacterium]|nr:helix-hairpin-helix domain-containing protein [Candidatus Omnitrophota bacterium]HOX10162.1 helix-hairpin-helix domain-containing protein [Candidatus Omnitrophota bacterium]HPN65908.1 helix-hairpin-helix domain-containing protein [Candidatus Omnitrophota bacterium]HRZ67820.1 helix-hairpin-helix domain-containing protein [Candidatus Omnitrophota bacterium]